MKIHVTYQKRFKKGEATKTTYGAQAKSLPVQDAF